MIILGIMYIQISLATKTFSEEDVIENFHLSSLYLLDQNIKVNQVFRLFLHQKVGVSIEEILPFVQYSSRFFGLPIEFKLHKACKYQENIDVRTLVSSSNPKKTYDTLLSYQNRNKSSLAYVMDNLYC